MKMNMSESTVNRRIKLLKKKIMKVIWKNCDTSNSFFYTKIKSEKER
jgi:hypothetical protein